MPLSTKTKIKTRTHPLAKKLVTKVLNPAIKKAAPLIGLTPLGRGLKAVSVFKKTFKKVAPLWHKLPKV